jgi:hypothetical protein
MNFQETLDKLCLMAVVPHHPKCPAGMDSRLKCECNAGMVKLKVEGCRVNLAKMYESAVAAMRDVGKRDITADKPQLAPQPQPNKPAPVAIEGTALPNRDTMPIIETPSFARGQMSEPQAPAASAPAPNGLPPGPRTAAVPVTKRPK